MRSKNRILIAPLDWGLGHASRCIHIIRQLTSLGAIPVIAGSGQSLSLLQKEFPDLEYHVLPNMDINYPAKGSFYWYFALRFRKMMNQINHEHLALMELLDKIAIDGIISDNRYGIYVADIPSVLITHQLNPPTWIFSRVLSPLVHRLINRFDHCWVPDNEGPDALAGNLSNSEHSRLKSPMYIGPLSRMIPSEKQAKASYSVLAILSGPEPHRSLFEKELFFKLAALPGNHVLVRGTLDKSEQNGENNIEVFDMLTSAELQDLIGKSQYLISRSGYSSIMDFVQLNRNALLIPTPGQNEQEYLGKLHADQDFFVVQKQGEINLGMALQKLNTLSGLKNSKKNQDLNQILVDFLDSLY